MPCVVFGRQFGRGAARHYLSPRLGLGGACCVRAGSGLSDGAFVARVSGCEGREVRSSGSRNEDVTRWRCGARAWVLRCVEINRLFRRAVTNRHRHANDDFHTVLLRH